MKNFYFFIKETLLKNAIHFAGEYIDINKKDFEVNVYARKFQPSHSIQYWVKKYGAHSVPEPLNKLIHIADKTNQCSVFNKITL